METNHAKDGAGMNPTPCHHTIIARYQAGDHDAINELIRINQPTVKACVNYTARRLRLSWRDPMRDDLMQIGLYEVIRAAKYFDCTQETSFASFLFVCVRKRIYQWMLVNRGIIRIPRDAYRLESCREDAYRASFVINSTSSDYSDDILKSIPTPATDVSNTRDMIHDIRMIISECTQRDQLIIEYLLANKTCMEISKAIGISDLEVRRSRDRIFGRIRKHFNVKGPTARTLKSNILEQAHDLHRRGRSITLNELCASLPYTRKQISNCVRTMKCIGQWPFRAVLETANQGAE